MIPHGLTMPRLLSLVVIALYHKIPQVRLGTWYVDKDVCIRNLSTGVLFTTASLKEMGIDFKTCILLNREDYMTRTQKRLRIILAADQDSGIGFNNTLPWKCSSDLKNFKAVTDGKVVIMGRKTFESLPPKGLPNRTIIVVSNTMKYVASQTHKLVQSLEEAIALAEFLSEDPYYVIGGERMFAEAWPLAGMVHFTRILGKFPCDRHCAMVDELDGNPAWELTSVQTFTDDIDRVQIESNQYVYKRR